MSPLPIFNQADARKYDIPGGTCWLYPDSPAKNLSFAYVVDNGRYPEKDFRKNLRCTEAIFVIEGALTLTLGGDARTLNPLDLVYIPLDTPYSIEGTGKSVVFIEPLWDSAQNVACDADGKPV